MERIRIIFWGAETDFLRGGGFSRRRQRRFPRFHALGCRMRMPRNMRFAALYPAARPAPFPMSPFCRCFPPADILTPMPSGC